MAYWLGVFVGALIFVYLWTRLWLWLFKKFSKLPESRRRIWAYGVAYVTAIIVGGAGFADGGLWDGGKAFLHYTPAFVIWFAIDLVRLGRRA
ncbi:hypothetical protein [Brevundimonas bullata]|uniref:hypothetical protein n=1 Tax=Brevundimonas bullata TaxID=13160 RepID=UPI0019AE0BC7|nr:hypothetical protein [Brevundimonas sp.]